MSRKLSRLLVLSVLILAIFSFPQFIQRAHAATGIVCIAPDLPGQTACPASPVALTGPVSTGPSTLIRVAVFIQLTDPMNGFEVTLLTNHLVALPVGVDLTGSIVGNGPTVLLECLQNVAVIGGPCSTGVGGTDTLDTLHFAVVAAAGGIPGGTTPPGSSGLLFTAIYQIQSAAAVAQAIGFQTGCTITSVASSTTCINISNGSTLPVLETAQGGTFTSSATQPFLQLSTTTTSFGNAFAGTSIPPQIITTTDTNGYGPWQFNGGIGSGDATISYAIAITGPSSTATGITATFAAPNPEDFSASTGNGFAVTNQVTFTNAATTTSGIWTIAVTGTYHFDPSCVVGSGCPGPASTLAETIIFTVTIEDFGFTINGSTSTAFNPFWCPAASETAPNNACPAGSSGVASLAVTSKGYTGTVTLANGAVSPITSSSPLVATLSTASIAGSSGTATDTFTGGLLRPSATSGSYSISVTSSGTLPINGVFVAAQTKTHPVTVLVRPQNFNISSATGPTISFASGASATDTLTIGSLPSGAAAGVTSAGFAGPVSLSSTITGGTGLTVTPTTTPVTLTAGHSVTDVVTFSGSVTTTTTFSVAITGTATLASSSPTIQTQSITYSVTIMGAAKDGTSTSIACIPGSINTGGTSSCTATVTDTTTPSSIPSGTVTFTLSAGTTGGSLSATTCTLSTTTGSCSVNFQGATAGGTATVGASYGGDNTHNGSTSATSATITVTVPKDNTATTIACSPGSINTGQTSSCTATVTDTTTPSNIPTGTVTFALAPGTTGGSLSSTTCQLSPTTGTCSVTFQSATAAGTASVSASYGGDTNHNTSASTVSASIAVTVPLDNTSTSVSCAPSSINTGQTSTCTATVTDTTTPSSIPSGTVTFTLAAGSTAGSLSATTCSLSTATGTCSVIFQGATATGTASVSASYGGDTTHNPSATTVSATITVSVPAHSTSTSVNCNAAIVVNEIDTCTATVTDSSAAPTTPTGTVSFAETGLTAGSFSGSPCQLVASATAGMATCNVTFSSTATGGANVVGTYSGDSTHSVSSNSASAFVILVGVRSVSVTVNCTPNPITTGQTSQCTATVTDTSPGTPTSFAANTVTFGSSDLSATFTPNPCTISGTTATVTCVATYTPSAAGTAMVTAHYDGSATHAAVLSSGFSLTINVPVDNTSTAVVCTPNSINTGLTSTCTATVTDSVNAGSIPSGTVTFTLNAGTTGGSLSSTTCNLSTTTGTCSVTFQGATTAGTATVSASYGGDATHHPSSSLTPATISVTVPTKDNTSTSIACTPASINAGQTSSCKATVTDITTASNIPTGTVTFTLNAGTTGGSLSSTTCPLDATGACTVTFQGSTTGGTATVSASYGGDTTHNVSSTSVSATITVTVPLDNTSTSVACTPASINVGQTSSCTATVTDTTNAASIPSGTITFTLNPGTTGGSLSAVTCTLSTTTGSCSVMFQGSTTPGTASVSASYGGDTTHKGSLSTVSATITVSQVIDNTTTSVACSPSSINIGQTSTCTATVSDTANAARVPSGTVTFTLNAGTTGGSLSATTCTLDTAGSCSVMFQGSTGSGTASVSASYGGDATHNASSSAVAATINVLAAFDYSLSNNGPITIQAGSSGTVTITATLISGTPQAVTLSCVPVPPATQVFSCNSFNPTSVTPTGTSILTISILAGTAPGDVSIQVTASPLGATTTPTTVIVHVTAPAKDNTSTVVACNPSSISTVQTSSCTATVTDTTTASNIPSGTVTFTLNAGTTGGSLSALTCTLDATGSCAVTFQGATAAGTASLSASYGGDTTHNTSTSTVSATITVTAPVDNTSTSVVCSPSSIITGQTSTCAATVIDTATASNIPTGMITFTLNSGTTGGSLSSTTCTLDATGSCFVTFQGTSAAGTASVGASYGGDATHKPSSSAVSATITVTVLIDTTSTAVACSPSSINAGQTSTCTATVTDTTTASHTPSGTVTFTLNAGTTGGSLSSTICTLDTTGSCSVMFQGSTADGTATVGASYSGDATHSGSTSVISATITVSVTTGQPFLLTFQAFNFSGFHNGIGPLTVLVNGNVVVVFPGHPFVSSSSTVVFGTDKWVSLGPYDITAFVIPGQNNVTFVNTFGIRFSLVRNVMVTQGSTTFLDFKGPRFISPNRPLTLTFSNPPLVITSLTSTGNLLTDNNVTFTATYSGGTGPFRCVFFFGDDEAAFTTGGATSCSVTHDFDDSGTVNVRVLVIGSSTSDKVSSSLTVTIADSGSDPQLTTALAMGVQTVPPDDD